MNATEQKNHKTALTQLEADLTDVVDGLSHTIERGLEITGQLIVKEIGDRSDADRQISHRVDDLARFRLTVIGSMDRHQSTLNEHDVLFRLSFWGRLLWLLLGRR